MSWSPGWRRVVAGLLMSAAAMPAMAVSAQDSFARCLSGIRASRAARTITDGIWSRHVAPLTPDSSVVTSLGAQPEFRLALWDYFAIMVDSQRVADGQRLMREHESLLAGIEKRYGVDPAVILAIWGVESDYGRGRGGAPVLRSLATLSCSGHRQRYFRTEFLAALRIVQRGDIPADRLRGSWAGAFGHTQFMPGTFEWLAVDYDGDGRRDVMDTVADALASTAHFLQRAGKWQRGAPWGFEVTVPDSFDLKQTGRRVQAPWSTWRSRGVTPAREALRVAAATQASILLPTGIEGPAFVVFHNYRALVRYNASDSYALAIAHLADRIRGAPPLATAWPTDDPGLSRADRRELQSLLGARGHAVGAPTAVLTPAVIAAVKAEQARLNVPVTGRPGQLLLAALRDSTSRR